MFPTVLHTFFSHNKIYESLANNCHKCILLKNKISNRGHRAKFRVIDFSKKHPNVNEILANYMPQLESLYKSRQNVF